MRPCNNILKVLFIFFVFWSVLQPTVITHEKDSRREALLRRVLSDRSRIFRLTGSLEITDAVLTYAREHELDPYLVTAVMEVESSFNPRARSYAGAIGLMQLLPIALRDLPELHPEMTKEDLWNPKKNVEAGTAYLAKLHNKFNGDWRLMLTAYNAGPTFVARQLKKNEALPEGYYQRVIQSYQKIKQDSFYTAF